MNQVITGTLFTNNSMPFIYDLLKNNPDDIIKWSQ